MSAARLFGLPHMPPADFVRLGQTFGIVAPKLGPDSAYANGTRATLEPNDLRGTPTSHLYLVGDKAGQLQFSALFRERYTAMAEGLRRERVARELTRSYREPVTTNLDAWFATVPSTVGLNTREEMHYREGLQNLLALGPIMHALWQAQVGFDENMQKLVLTENLTADDRELIARYGHPWGTADQGEWAVALPSLPERTSGVIPGDLTREALGTALTGFANPFSAVVRNKMGFLEAVPYALLYRAQLQEAARLLALAAEAFTMIPREATLVDYLNTLSTAFQSAKPFPFVASDAAWFQHGQSDSLLFVRIGPDETGGPGVGNQFHLKALFGLNVGLRNFASQRLVDRFARHMEAFEQRFAALIGDDTLYQAKMPELNLPEFWDIIMATGENIGGPNGTPIGQTLPNWAGEDGLGAAQSRIMIYVNKTKLGYKPALMQQYILPLFAPAHRADFPTSSDTAIESVVLHEIAHNLGPKEGKLRPGSTTASYGAPLGKWHHTFEEFKAQTGALLFPGDLLQRDRALHAAGAIDDDTLARSEAWYRQHLVSDLAWAFRMILRAARDANGGFAGGPYSKLAAMQVGFLAEQGALRFDQQNGWWEIDFDKMPAAVEALAQTMLRLYAKGDFEAVNTFATRYTDPQGDGFPHLHVDRLIAVAGNMPSALFDYQVDI